MLRYNRELVEQAERSQSNFDYRTDLGNANVGKYFGMDDEHWFMGVYTRSVPYWGGPFVLQGSGETAGSRFFRFWHTDPSGSLFGKRKRASGTEYKEEERWNTPHRWMPPERAL